MTDERALEVLQDLLDRGDLGIREEEYALKIAIIKIERSLGVRPECIEHWTPARRQLFCAIVQSLGARGDVPDADLLERARVILEGNFGTE